MICMSIALGVRLNRFYNNRNGQMMEILGSKVFNIPRDAEGRHVKAGCPSSFRIDAT